MKDQRFIDNTILTLNELYRRKRATQIELTKCLPMKRTNVFYHCEKLQQLGLIKASASSVVKRGRPSPTWELSPQVGQFLVVYFEIDKTSLAVINFNGDISLLKEGVAQKNIDEGLSFIKSILQDSGIKSLLGIMLVLSGTIDSANGEVVNSRNWHLKRYQLARELQKRLDLPENCLIKIENCTNMATWGERIAGVVQSIDSYITLHIHTGAEALALGSGLVLDGSLFRGERGMAGELDRSYYNWLKKHYNCKNMPRVLVEMDDDDIDAFAADIGENFAHLVNYLALRKIVIIAPDCECRPLFVDSFRCSVTENLLDDIAMGFDIECASGTIEMMMNGAADILITTILNDSARVASLLE